MIETILRQEEHSEPVMTIENQTVTRFNPILRSFNRVVSKCTVDARKDSVSVFLITVFNMCNGVTTPPHYTNNQ